MTSPTRAAAGDRRRPVVMGVVNVTPDSFSDGGRHADAPGALAHARQLVADGADIVDVGGESTRPGATRPLVAEELGRVAPVISALAAEGVVVSVDTMRSEVAAAALEAGAAVVNDVSGGLADPRILRVVADSAASYVAMHWRAHSDRMAQFARYDDGVVHEVRRELSARIEAAQAAGIPPSRLVIDPGLGFAKHGEHNWELVRDIESLTGLGYRVLVGASRKSFLGGLLADDAGTPRPVDDREEAGHALTVLLAGRVWGVRVHDVRGTRDVLRVWEAVTCPEQVTR